MHACIAQTTGTTSRVYTAAWHVVHSMAVSKTIEQIRNPRLLESTVIGLAGVTVTEPLFPLS